MKFSVGYPLQRGEQTFFETMHPLLDRISEVYFAFPFTPSGRSAAGTDFGLSDYGAIPALLEDIYQFRRAGVRLCLLFNANCYGADAMSLALERSVFSVLSHLEETTGLPETVTCASPAVAFAVKKYNPDIRTRASVNMRIGTVEGLDYLSDRFDEYVLQRDYNRDVEHIARLCEWCRQNGKTPSLLVNSGCLRFCSGQTFHDNMVAHGAEADMRYPMEGFSLYTCWNYLQKKPENLLALLRSTWIRPEDLHYYEPYFSTVKLATRMHPAPYMVLEAYAKGKFTGNLLDLFEPGYGSVIAPKIVDNTKFSPDWFTKVLACRKDCEHCSVCRDEWEKVCVDGGEK